MSTFCRYLFLASVSFGVPLATSSDALARLPVVVDPESEQNSDRKWKEAEAAFLAAWALNPTFDVAYNLGTTEHELGKHRSAAEHLSFALRNWPLLGSLEKLKPLAQKRFAVSRGFVGAVGVKVNVANAEVLVDGTAVGKAPLAGELFVEPGAHRVEARLEGYEAAGETIRVAKGGAVAVTLAMAAAQPVATGGPAAEEEARPAKPAASAAGAASAAPAAPVRPAEPAEQRSWVPVIALGAASVVGLGVAVGMTVASNDASDDAHARRKVLLNVGEGCVNPTDAFVDQCSGLHSASSRADALGNAARVAFVASGALAAAAVTYALWPRSERAASGHVRAMPNVLMGSMGMTVLGAW
jgi:hypothetical protein